MDIRDFSEKFNLSSAEIDFVRNFGYDEFAARQDGEIPDFLQKDFILEQIGKLRFDINSKLLLDTAAAVRQDPYLVWFLKYLFYYWFERREQMHYNNRLPLFENTPEYADNAGIFYLLTALASFPIIERKYTSLNIPQKYALDTIQYMQGALMEYAAGHAGKLGIASRKLHWFSFYTKGILFRIGRLEFMYQEPLYYLPAAFRRNSDGKVIALCRDKWQFSADGLRLFADDDPEKAAFTAVLTNNADSITGTPLNPLGYAEIDRLVTLDLHQYTPLWSQWDLVPGVHIPGGGNMTPELCCESLNAAVGFFEKYFHRQVAGFSCFSWIFNPDFEQELPQSNLADFMRQLYLFPFPSTGKEGLEFIFGKSSDDWSDYPEDNSLRRAFHRIRRAGKRLKAGGMFIEKRGLENYSSAIYRADYPDQFEV